MGHDLSDPEHTAFELIVAVGLWGINSVRLRTRVLAATYGNSQPDILERSMLRIAARTFFVFWLAVFAGQAACASKRLALVIGVNKYSNPAAHVQLQRAVNDARSIARAFGELGFETRALEDTGRARFNEEWQQFLGKSGMAMSWPSSSPVTA